jgi:hypothetical protein
MSGFDDARIVEAESLLTLRPFLEEQSGGHYWITPKGPLARCFQEQHGDVLFTDRNDRMRSVELKAERKHTGNLFLEEWSNRNFDDRESYLRLGSNPGWLSKLRSDLLFYHFLDCDTLYILNLWHLQRWAFGWSGGRSNLYRYEQKVQKRHSQANTTVGRIVPVIDLKNAGLVRVFHPRQVELWPEAAE